MIRTLTKQKIINDIVHIGSYRYVSGYKRPPFFPILRRSEVPQLFYSLKERLAEKDEKLLNPELYKKVNIGLPVTKLTRGRSFKGRIKQQKDSKTLRKISSECKLLVNLEQENDWTVDEKPNQVKLLAENNQIYNHLFGDYAYFYPTVHMNINYYFDEDTESPVYFGNTLKPKETTKSPNITIKNDDDSLFTLLLTNPDGNLYDNDAEIAHWFMGNIPGGKIEEGEEILNYMQPIPFKGTGFHRYVFVLYKQNKKIDFSDYKKKLPCLNLKQRTFKTYDFYKKYEDSLTPCSLSWFHSDWDSSLTNFFHHTLDMKEPNYKYEFPKAYMAPQKWFPVRRPFNRYMDMHRDPKELQKLMLIKRLNGMHPFKGESPPRPPYPLANPVDKDLPIWMQNEIRDQRSGRSKYRYMYRGDDRPYQSMEKPNTLFSWVRKYNL